MRLLDSHFWGDILIFEIKFSFSQYKFSFFRLDPHFPNLNIISQFSFSQCKNSIGCNPTAHNQMRKCNQCRYIKKFFLRSNINNTPVPFYKKKSMYNILVAKRYVYAHSLGIFFVVINNVWQCVQLNQIFMPLTLKAVVIHIFFLSFSISLETHGPIALLHHTAMFGSSGTNPGFAKFKLLTLWWFLAVFMRRVAKSEYPTFEKFMGCQWRSWTWNADWKIQINYYIFTWTFAI